MNVLVDSVKYAKNILVIFKRAFVFLQLLYTILEHVQAKDKVVGLNPAWPNILRRIKNLYHLYIYINGRRINYKYVIATNSFACIIIIFRLYNIEKYCLMLHLYDR